MGVGAAAGVWGGGNTYERDNFQNRERSKRGQIEYINEFSPPGI